MDNKKKSQAPARDLEPLTPEELEARRAWYREYRANNPEMVRRWEKSRWAKKARQREAAGRGGS